LYLERGIALAKLAHTDAARSDFRRAIVDATDGRGPPPEGERKQFFDWFGKLADRIEDGEGIDLVTLTEWNKSLSSFK